MSCAYEEPEPPTEEERAEDDDEVIETPSLFG
jgi:hypothetical protein